MHRPSSDPVRTAAAAGAPMAAGATGAALAQAVRATGVIKRYGGVVALDGMNLTVERGTVHAVIGTTLMGIGITAVLAMGLPGWQPIALAAAAGFVLSLPASWLIARQIVGKLS